MSTALGVLAGFAAPLALAAAATWLLVAWVTRYSSLAAIAASLVTPAAGFLLLADPWLAACVTVICAILIWRHRENIRKLLAGTESRIGQK